MTTAERRASTPDHRPCLVIAIALCCAVLLGCHRLREPAPPAYPPPPGASSWAPGGPWLALPPPQSDAGVLVRMLVAECKGPGYAQYDEREAVVTMQAMKAVVHNRLFHDPGRFGARGAHYYADIICAPGQWEGFGRGGGGEHLIAPEILQRVDEILARANTGSPGPYHRFVQHALAITYGGVIDPYAQLRSVDGVAVLPGAYGWRRHDASSPGGDFVAIPTAQGGLLGGNRFYALRARPLYANQLWFFDSGPGTGVPNSMLVTFVQRASDAALRLAAAQSEPDWIAP